MLALPNDSPRKILFVALTMCLACSVVVSTAAVMLRPLQVENRALDFKRNILAVAGLLEAGGDINQLFEQIEARAVDLQTGEFIDTVDAATFDQRAAARDASLGKSIPADKDFARIRRRAKYANVYFVREGDGVELLILPMHGSGLWSTMYGFLALKGDLTTVSGIKFYEHAETAGLGDQIENPAWRALWEGKLAFDEAGDLRLQVIKGRVDAGSLDARHQVDGLSGATLTANGVTNMIRYWLGEEGFGPFLANLREKGA
jgi:Na+-transporting NADH:ubiquinone oxidoreductase subunit C